ncbi:protein phosphatase 1 regulatory subunit 42-like [Copidosoma floridanum]|uniref:protein phosphatase 1 regulatory subunit 42-like n=1 Tax=Copidosoma floridanum TaxID=29053 RepID=UPI0006C95EEF|nr:protein phosphatase 1 regulatory subunit 42-like [Copidosoma floridanum]
MVKLTVPLIEKKYLQQQSCKSLTREIDKHHLKKISHIFMNEQNIDEIDDFSVCKNLRVIYLQRNIIEKIENIDFAKNLTHLYLQHNKITKIENLGNLVNLKKLYLGYNSIAIVEGLEKLTNLSELHIEKQKLDGDKFLRFHPRSIKTLSYCLVHLNISDNKITNLSDINHLKKLTTLEAQDNLINDIYYLTKTVSSLRQLENLFLQGNPVTKTYRYRENIIGNSYSLVILDNKVVSENSREFLQRFKVEKLKYHHKTFNGKESQSNADT